MKDTFKTLNSGRAIFILLFFICFILAGAALKITAPVILPFTIAILLASVLYPIVSGLDRFRIPRIISIILAVSIVVSGLYTFGIVLFSSGRTILSLFPRYESRLTEIYIWLARYLELSYDEDISFLQNLWNQIGVRERMWGMTYSLSNSFVEFLKNAFLVVLFMVFLLVEASYFTDKLELAFEQRSQRIKLIGADIMRQVTRYLAAKFFISVANGVAVAVTMSIVGLEFAVVWGLVQFVLNFIPNLGSIASGVLISVFALLQFWPEPGPIILVIAIILGINIVLSYILEPKIIGDNVGISPFVVLASLVIWGWLWGFAGMILAVPMMVIIKIIFENISFLEPVSILLGSRKAVLSKKAAHEAASPETGHAE
jgi:predicted PurR-regulated permease PerM